MELQILNLFLIVAKQAAMRVVFLKITQELYGGISCNFGSIYLKLIESTSVKEKYMIQFISFLDVNFNYLYIEINVWIKYQ